MADYEKSTRYNQELAKPCCKCVYNNKSANMYPCFNCIENVGIGNDDRSYFERIPHTPHGFSSDPDKPEFLGGPEAHMPRQTSHLFKIPGLHALSVAAMAGKYVVVPWHPIYHKKKSASWIMRLPAFQVLRLIDMGMFIYQKGAKQE